MMASNLISEASRDYVCDRCERVIRMGELYYRNYGKKRKVYTYCMSCLPQKRGMKEKEFVQTLEGNPLFPQELHHRFGPSYRDTYKRLKRKGFDIHCFRIQAGKGKPSRRFAATTIYYLGQDRELAYERIKDSLELDKDYWKLIGQSIFGREDPNGNTVYCRVYDIQVTVEYCRECHECSS